MKKDDEIGRFARFLRLGDGPTDRKSDQQIGMTLYRCPGAHMKRKRRKEGKRKERTEERTKKKERKKERSSYGQYRASLIKKMRMNVLNE